MMNGSGQTLAVSIKGLRKTLDKINIGPMDLEVEPGYIVAIVGPNGSGKSSLFRLLMNVTKPEAGEIRLLGRQYEQDEIALKRRVGYVSESEEWSESGFKTVKELTEFVAYWYPNWDESLVRDLFVRFGLDNGQKLAHLSKGMKRKLAFIYAMAYDPDVLLLDEPTAGLDPFAWRMMMDEIASFMDRGQKTVLFATHILDEVKRMADYVAFIHQGKLLGMYEKDVLLDGWKRFWVERSEQPLSQLAGVVSLEERGGSTTVKIVSNAPGETEAALKRIGVKILQTQAVELDEILGFLMDRQMRDEGQGAE